MRGQIDCREKRICSGFEDGESGSVDRNVGANRSAKQ